MHQTQYREFKKHNEQEQQNYLCAKKVADSRKQIDKIVAGKRKKLLQSGVNGDEIAIDAEQVLKEIGDGCSFNTENTLIQVPTEHPYESLGKRFCYCCCLTSHHQINQ